jgi:endoglucanase
MSLKLRAVILSGAVVFSAPAQEIYIRANQVGYRLHEPKIALGFSKSSLPERFTLLDLQSGRVVFEGKPAVLAQSWGQFSNHVALDFSSFQTPGRFQLQLAAARSVPFCIDSTAGDSLASVLLEFMREQRCGYNPWLDAVCHPFDGRTAYGPLTNGTYLDARGGWHDAADLLKYQLTSGNATAQMLLAYELARHDKPKNNPALEDRCNALGQAGPNGIPDLLDEARWGLEWLLKLHPSPSELYHQVADDRDHAGRRLPQDETVDYGWGKGGARVVYFANGQPQGLLQYKSESTGVANLAGRYAAAMGLAWQIWREAPAMRGFAGQCLRAGEEVYALGRAKPGVQQGNSFKAPYRYEESTWADDMEWGAAELFRATGKRTYLQQAREYASRAANDTWMGKQQTHHYQFYPFINLGHYRLYPLVDRKFRRVLADYYRQGIEACRKAGANNPYDAGVPFIWCSNNLIVALATQCLLYEEMTGDAQYRPFAAAQRHWLLGRNPWGTTMFTGIGEVYPRDPHLMTMQLSGREVRGGLVDGPVYERIFTSLRGVSIKQPDRLAQFQGPAVYHDDSQDYSSNEPTMDGTASAILLFALCSRGN